MVIAAHNGLARNVQFLSPLSLCKSRCCLSARRQHHLQCKPSPSFHTVLQSVHNESIATLASHSLVGKVRGHKSAITTLQIFDVATVDNGIVIFASASLDKMLKFWSISVGDQGEALQVQQVLEQEVAGGPVFSLLEDVFRRGELAGRKGGNRFSVFCGKASKDISMWEAGSSKFRMATLDGLHTGWVRSLAMTGRWLFSCGCNFCRVWDTTAGPIPKPCGEIKLFTGDILSLAAGDGVLYAATVAGAIHCWTVQDVGKHDPVLQPVSIMEGAHKGRITAIVLHNRVLYSAGYDGKIKAWSTKDGHLKPVAVTVACHEAKRIYCLVMGPDGLLYSGGDDQVVRCWQPHTLSPAGEPLHGHTSSVRALSAGQSPFILSGDAEGYISMWRSMAATSLQAPQLLPSQCAL